MNKSKFLFKILWDFFKKYKYRILSIFVFIYLFEVVQSTLIRPYLLKILADKFQNGSLTLTAAFLIVFLYSLFSSLDYFIDATLSWKLDYTSTTKIEKDARIYLMNYALQHSLEYFNNKMSGVIANKISNVSEAIGTFFHITSKILSAVLIFLISVVIYLRINPYLSLIFLIWIVCFYLIFVFVIKKLYEAKNENLDELNKISGLMNDDLMNIMNIKIFSKRKKELENVKKQGIKILDKERRLTNIEALFNSLMFLINGAIYLFAFLFGFYLTYKGKITIGDFLFLCQNVVFIASIVSDIFESYLMEFTIVISEIKDGIDTILEPIDINDKKGAKILKNVKGKIVFKNIIFNYKDNA